MMHSAERRFLIKELVVVMVGYLYANVSFPVPSLQVSLRNFEFDPEHIRNKSHHKQVAQKRT